MANQNIRTNYRKRRRSEHEFEKLRHRILRPRPKGLARHCKAHGTPLVMENTLGGVRFYCPTCVSERKV
jgi:hypothetical protein